MSEEKNDAPTEEKSSETAVEKKEEKPEPKQYTPEEIAEIAKKVESPKDNTPPYVPTHVLSPEYGGASNYELGVKGMLEEKRQLLENLQNNPDASSQQIKQAQEDLKTIEYLYQNYNLGMNVFRTAKGGRDKLRE